MAKKSLSLRNFRALSRLPTNLTTRQIICWLTLFLFGIATFACTAFVPDQRTSASPTATINPSIAELLTRNAQKIKDAQQSEALDEDALLSTVPPAEPQSWSSSSTAIDKDALLPKDQQALDALTVSAEHIGERYDRKEWDKSWTSGVHNYLGWQQTNCHYAFYDNIGDCSGNNDRDHMVSLPEAHRSGGHEWSRTRKEAFYLETDNLYVLSISLNRSKSDQDPANWAPIIEKCRYAREWIAIKTEWGLSIDTAEKQALNRMLNTCLTP